MIPSSPRRTWIFLLATLLAFYGPGFLAPAAWDKNATYLLVSNIYQVALVVAGFWYGPAICRALVIKMIVVGPLRQAVDCTLAELRNSKGPVHLAKISVSLVEHTAPFIVTAGLLPGRSEIFLSSALAEGLGENGLRFLLARALVHADFSQRLAALLPVLVLTVIPGIPSGALAWLELVVFLVGWLALHWLFEMLADRKAAQALGHGAGEGLREMLVASAAPVGWLSMQPPIRWRLRMVAGN